MQPPSGTPVKRPNKPQFAMLQLEQLQRLIELFSAGVLKPGDAVALLALLSHTDTFSGKIHVMPSRLADDVQVNPKSMITSLSRLKKVPDDVVAAAEAALAGTDDVAAEKPPATRKRARNRSGEFQPDDPTTTEANEAFVEG